MMGCRYGMGQMSDCSIPLLTYYYVDTGLKYRFLDTLITYRHMDTQPIYLQWIPWFVNNNEYPGNPIIDF